jgi:hypothetical protein
VGATKTYSDRSNARKAAKRLIAAGHAPASEFEIDVAVDGRWTIIWKTRQARPAGSGRRKSQTADGQAKATGTRQSIAEQGITANTHKRLVASAGLVEARSGHHWSQGSR